jgi:hypothetical protein
MVNDNRGDTTMMNKQAKIQSLFNELIQKEAAPILPGKAAGDAVGKGVRALGEILRPQRTLRFSNYGPNYDGRSAPGGGAFDRLKEVLKNILAKARDGKYDSELTIKNSELRNSLAEGARISRGAWPANNMTADELFKRYGSGSPDKRLRTLLDPQEGKWTGAEVDKIIHPRSPFIGSDSPYGAAVKRSNIDRADRGLLNWGSISANNAQI